MGNIATDSPVDVYFNLHKKVWSVRCRKTGKVVMHARMLHLPDGCTFVVQPAGNRKAVETGQKNVHAFVRTDKIRLASTAEAYALVANMPQKLRASYNPARATHFYEVTTGTPVERASEVVLLAPEGQAPQMWMRRH